MKSSSDLERYFLTNLYYKPELIKQIVIPDECIEDKVNRFILDLFKECYEKSKKLDFPTLLALGKFEKVSENQFREVFTQMISENSEVDIVNFDFYQETLFNIYKEKQLKKISEDFKNNKLNIDEFISKVQKISNYSIKTNAGIKTYEEIKELVTSNNKTINFSLEKLSARMKLQEHDMMVISARTGIGKSGFALNLLEDLSQRYKCLFFNMEMSETSVYKRLISIMTRIPMDMLATPVNDYQKEVIDTAIKDLSKRNLKIYSQGQTIEAIRRTIINEQREGHTIVFIDYVGLISSVIKYKSLYELVTAVVKELRAISMSYDCTIVLLAQINRNGEEKPKLSDLKESGELEQSATQVLILSGEETNKPEQEITVTLAKHREGKKGEIEMLYNRANQIFKEI